MYCPICKNEYQHGIIICPDCGSDLVDEEYKEVLEAVHFKSEKVKDRFIKYLDYCNIAYTVETNDVDENYHIMCEEDSIDKINTAFLSFLYGENEKAIKNKPQKNMNEIDSDNIKEFVDFSMDEKTQDDKGFLEELMSEEVVLNLTENRFHIEEDLVYTSASYKASDSLSTGYFFILFGGCGLIVIALCFLGILEVFSSPFAEYVMGALFIAMFAYGIVLISKNKDMKAAADKEDALLEEISEWQKDNITVAMLDEAASDCDTDEEKDLVKFSLIRTKTNERFPNLASDFLEHVCDTFYAFLEESETSEELEDDNTTEI